MKTHLINCFVLAAVCFAACGTITRAHGASYAIGIPPNNDTSQGTQVLQSLLIFMLETAAPGDEVSVVDALNQNLVARFAIPEGKLFQANSRARAQRLASSMAAIKQFILAERSYPRDMTSVVALPQFLDFAATQLRRPGEPLRVIVIGSPFYMGANGDSAFNMDTAYPSDAHITSDQQRSVFGCALRKRILSGVTVHFAYSNAHFLNDYHQERITRFWALYCQETGGGLCTFCPDAGIAFQRARENIQQPCVTTRIDPNDTKLEMRQVMHRTVSVAAPITNIVSRVIVTSDVARVTAAFPLSESNAVSSTGVSQSTNSTQAAELPHPQEVLTNGPSISMTRLAEAFPVKASGNKMGLGIAWSASVDLDLWVRANSNARDLYFQNTVTREGRYFRDWRDRNMGIDYEYVELNTDAAADLSTISCWVNYYEGKASPVRGVIVVIYQGNSYYGEFTLHAPGGNKAADYAKRDQSGYWVRIDVARIIRAGSQIRPTGSSR